MGRLILAIIAFVLAMAVLKMVIVALVIAGLIFRTKETIGLLAIGGVLTLIAVHPILGLSIVAVLIVVGILLKNKEKREAAAALAMDDPAQE